MFENTPSLVGLYLALLRSMRFVPSRHVGSSRAALVLCAIVAAFGLDSSLNARVAAAPLIVQSALFDPAFEGPGLSDQRQPPSSPFTTGVGTEKDRIADAPPDGPHNPDSRDVPIHVPEPATLILTSIGLGGLAASGARRRWATRS